MPAGCCRISPVSWIGRVRDAPAFAYSLPMNTHISYAQGQPILGESHPGFDSAAGGACPRDRWVHGDVHGGPEGARALRQQRDHNHRRSRGRSRGKAGAGGTVRRASPKIVRIPLIVHLPPRLAARWAADVDAVSLSTDIVPTLYALLDQDVTLHGPVVGMSLVYPAEHDLAAAERRRGSFLLIGSYGAGLQAAATQWRPAVCRGRR